MPTILRPEVFDAVLLSSPALVVTDEQRFYIKEILDICCSDSRFAEKAYVAITRVLTVGPVIPPVVTSLNPSTVVLGSPTFDIHVLGTGFSSGSIIVFNGYDEPTTLVSPTELTTGVNMDVWLAPATVPVGVRNPDGVLSDSMNFEFTDVAQTLSTPAKSSQIGESKGVSGEQKPSKESGR